MHGLWYRSMCCSSPNTSTYPYSDDGRLPGDPEGLLDPFTSLTFAAAHTERLRLGTGICLVPSVSRFIPQDGRRFGYFSGGRVDFGVGIGWLKEEFANLGMDFLTRGLARKSTCCHESPVVRWNCDSVVKASS